jgi:hypothetical protein
MNDDIRNFGTGPGKRVVARDWAGVHAPLAPWMQDSLSIDDVRTFFEDAYWEVLKENGVEGLRHSEKFHIGGTFEMTAKELHSPVGSWSNEVRPVSELVTDENKRYWMRQFSSA